MNTLYDTPEKYDMYPPSTWAVERRVQGRSVTYCVIIEPGRTADTFGTRADAESLIRRPSSWLRVRYEKEKAARLSGDRVAVLA